MRALPWITSLLGNNSVLQLDAAVENATRRNMSRYPAAMRPFVILLTLMTASAAATPIQFPGLPWNATAATVTARLRSQGYKQETTASGSPMSFRGSTQGQRSTLETGFTDAGGLDWVRVCFKTDRAAIMTKAYSTRYGKPGHVPTMDGPPLYDNAAAFWPARTGRAYNGPALYVGSLAGDEGTCRTALEFHRTW
ncbi:hypothetical protein ACVWZX_004532 [Deinococcus sp. UYEF24]